MTRIIPITELRNTNEISKEAHRINEPIFVTKNGFADLAIMSIDVFNSMSKLTKPTFVEKSKFKIGQQDVNYGFINVATCNFKGKISGVKSNYEQMIKLIDEASNNQSKIILFPELCLCSYTLGDIILNDDLLDTVGPNWCGFDNFKYIFQSGVEDATSITFFNHTFTANAHIPTFLYYLMNTMVIWIIGFIPQIIISLALAVWFTDARLKIRGQRFWKTIMYMPNLIMASAFGMLFLMIFATNGPVFQLLISWGWVDGNNLINVANDEMWTHIIIAGLNCLMWFGNTTLLLMSGIMGIDESIFESARIDGSGAQRTFWSITMPLLKPIFLYVFITSMIGGVQLFDIAQIFTQTTGGYLKSSETVMMYLYNLVTVKHNYGQAGALSIVLFIITLILSCSVYLSNYHTKNMEKEIRHNRKKRFRTYAGCIETEKEIARQRGESL